MLIFSLRDLYTLVPRQRKSSTTPTIFQLTFVCSSLNYIPIKNYAKQHNKAKNVFSSLK